MKSHGRVTTFLTLAFFVLALILGGRFAARQIAAPFEGLDRLARMPRPASAPEMPFVEPIRNIDWEAPAPSPAPRNSKSASRTPPKSTRPATNRVDAAELLAKHATLTVVLGEALANKDAARLELRLAAFAIVDEPNVESLAKSLNLSESQKAWLNSLIDWRKWSIDALSEADKANSAVMDRINATFRETVLSGLDPTQAKKYREMKPEGSTLMIRSVAAAALKEIEVPTQVQSTQPEFLKNFLKAQGAK